MMQLQMQGYQAGLFDLWEVRLVPGAASPALLYRWLSPPATAAARRSRPFAAIPASRPGRFVK